MIQTAAWFSASEDHGVWSPPAKAWKKPAPSISDAEKIPDFLRKPVKYYPRMTRETRCCLFAAALALQNSPPVGEMGILSAGSTGWTQACAEYFRDYVDNGRTLGRGNLFIYTLPTSPLGEVAIALELTGPCMFIHEKSAPVAGLIRAARQMIADREADRMALLLSDTGCAVCFDMNNQPGESEIEQFISGHSPLPPRDLCHLLRDRAGRP
jgi:hypothetical protein